MPGQFVDEEGGDAECPPRRPALGLGHDEAALHLGDRLADAEHAAEEVHVPDPEPGALRPAQAEGARHQDECSVLARYGLRPAVQLFERERRGRSRDGPAATRMPRAGERVHHLRENRRQFDQQEQRALDELRDGDVGEAVSWYACPPGTR